MIKIVKGNVLEAKEHFIAHQTNCLGTMGAGVAKAIAKKYPHVETAYINACYKANKSSELLGKIQIIACDPNDKAKTGQCIVNIFGQHKVGTYQRQTDYDALREAFAKLNAQGCDVAIPYLMGCGLGGGNWDIVSKIIEETCVDINVVAYDIDGKAPELKEDSAKKKSITGMLQEYFEDESFTLKDAYKLIESEMNVNKESIRARIYEGLEKGLFERLAKGVYKLSDGKTSTVLIKGNGRDLSMIEDKSIDCIITDHPWENSKANKGGNRDFADYDCFKYEQRDFDEKARVLKDGCFLVEFLPYESETNFDYLYEIKKMAQKSGFQYYALVPWKKGTFVSNTGRVSKDKETMMFFSKGNPRCLRRDAMKNKAEALKNNFEIKGLTAEDIEKLLIKNNLPTYKMSGANGMLPAEFNYQPPSRDEKIHKAEKPAELIAEIMKYVTLKGETVLDTFGGSGSTAVAGKIAERNTITIELGDKEFEAMFNRVIEN